MPNPNATEQIANYIKENILNGNFKIGSKLPSERKIAEQFNISRIPVRKAIEKLCQEEILKVEPYSRPIVQGFKKLDLFDSSEPFNSQDIQEIYVEALRTRQLIESEAAKLAAVTATEDERKAIKKAYLTSIDELHKVYLGLLDECSDADLYFHKEIITASHSPLFIQYYELISKTVFSNQYFGFKYRTSLKDMIEHHDKIMNAIEKKDGDLAYGAMHDHLEDVIQLFQRR
jgi:DNA-binding FadR family transcriptional regulator